MSSVITSACALSPQHTELVQILTVEQQQLLEFIEACTANGYSPTEGQVLSWFESPEPREARYERRLRQPPRAVTPTSWTLGKPQYTAFRGIPAGPFNTPNASQLFAKGFAGMWSQALDPVAIGRMALQASRQAYVTVQVAPAESSVEHMVRLGWLTDHEDHGTDEGDEHSEVQAGLHLTDLGEALLANARRAQVEDEATVVSFDANSSDVAYAKLVGVLSQHGSGLLLDRYLDLDGLARLHASTGIRRFLVGTQQGQGRINELRHYLYDKDCLEIRRHSDFHDRAFVFDSHKVFLLGTSLNALGGRSPTVLAELTGASAATATASAYNKLWDEAEVLAPQE